MQLRPCTPDNITLPFEVEQRFKELSQAFIAKRGLTLQIPGELRLDWNLFVGLRQRHRTGDFRQTEDEAMAVQRIAGWTIRVNAVLRGQPQPKFDID